MCIALIWIAPSSNEGLEAWEAFLRLRYRVIIASNRDELLHRTTSRATKWEASPHVFAARDLVAGGTWLGVAGDASTIVPAKRWAVVTNVREPDSNHSGARSRGTLAADFLETSGCRAADFCRRIQLDAYGAFNVLFGDEYEVWYASNRGDQKLRRLNGGWHCLSNGSIDSPWPKCLRGLANFRAAVRARFESGPEMLSSALLNDVLADATSVQPATDTGCSLELERVFARVHVPMIDLGNGDYGTRTSTVCLIHDDKSIFYRERDLDPESRTWSNRQHVFSIHTGYNMT